MQMISEGMSAEAARAKLAETVLNFDEHAPEGWVKVKIVIEEPNGRKTVLRSKKARAIVDQAIQPIGYKPDPDCRLLARPIYARQHFGYAGFQFAADGDDALFTVEEKKPPTT